MRFSVGAAGFFVLLGVVPSRVRAQEPAAGASPASADTAAPEASAAPPSPPAPRAARAGNGAAEARSPGFETLGDGSTRLTVELSQPVTYDAKTAPNRLTYVLKGAHIARRNDANPLVTLHFNTPVVSARLVPRGRDLLFALELRAATTPTVTTDTAKDGGIVLRIEFPKGDYLPASDASEAPTPEVPDDDAVPSTAPAAAPSHPASPPADRPRKSRSHH